MAIPIGISRLTGLGRAGSDLTEFMAEPEPSALLHTICAFANDIDNVGGGYLVIGIEEENGSPVLPPKGMLMYGKEASNRKQEIDRQHYTIPNQRPKDKHCGKI